jgi:hypothetical protein
MLAADVYMAQHPGVPTPQATQSVWVHLVGLCLTLEHGFGGVASARAKARLAAPDAVFVWLPPPRSLGTVTVFDVLALDSPERLRAGVEHWARSVWSGWIQYHGQIRSRAADLARART